MGTRISGRSRAFLKVQDGCDHACAYCAVTLVRGPSRSVPANEVATALKRIRNAGFEEVVFTGVDISAWGIDIDGEIRDYVDLVEMAAETGIPRIRVSSLEPWEIDPKRIERLAGIEPWCEHFHISLQSAAPYVLERMNRTTDIGKLKEALRELLRQRPRATLGADIIAGFPGEREQDFRQTLRFLDEGPYTLPSCFPIFHTYRHPSGRFHGPSRPGSHYRPRSNVTRRGSKTAQASPAKQCWRRNGNPCRNRWQQWLHAQLSAHEAD